MKIIKTINKDYLYHIGLFMAYLYIFYILFDICYNLHLIKKHIASIDNDITYMFGNITTEVE
jgi:hypothetical protein